VIWYFLIIAVSVAADQLIKMWALESLAPVGTIQFIPGLLKWTYVENRGAAFGMFAGQRWILSAVSIVIVLACIVLLVKKYFKTGLENVCVALIAGGGIGNLIDRISRGFVVDYIDINELFPYPMFNLADCCVVVGAILLAVYIIIDDAKKEKEKKAALTETVEEATEECSCNDESHTEDNA